MKHNIVLFLKQRIFSARIIWALLSLFFVFNFCITSQAVAQSLELTNLVFDSQNGTMQVRFGLEVKDADLLKDYLQENGALLQLKCQVSLFRQRSLWWDELLIKKTLNYKLKGNPLTQKYWLKKSNTDKFIQKKELEALFKDNWKNINIGLGPWVQMSKGEMYSLYLEVSMKRIDVPKWLQRALFFWSWEVIPKNTYRLDFAY